jgi:carboxyl-terminal processing protease
MKIYGRLLIGLILSSFLFTSVNAGDLDKDYYKRLKKNWIYMQRVYEQINMHYVEEIDPQPLIKAAIDGMLEQLDPYTVFIEDGDRRMRIITTGKYGGLGMEVGIRNKKVTVISPFENSPAKKAGILAGDIIRKIDGRSIRNLRIEEVSKRLKGKLGTEVQLEIQRPGINEPFTLSIKRAEIVIKDVDYYAFIEPGIAYISLSGFSDKSPGEVKHAITQLQKQGKIKGLIIDLRGNPGGLLESAVEIVNIFVDKGIEIVTTRGYREGDVSFKTDKNPILPDVPLAILVSGGSASASEIVAGSLQDLDRAVIVGEPTFGKGLVQKVYTIDKNTEARLKITTAKYYIPSGRCIQKEDYTGNNEVILTDTEKNKANNNFFTRNGRPVGNHGGINPDLLIKGDSANFVIMQLIRANLLFDFAVQYHNNHTVWNDKPAENDSIYTEFMNYLKENNFKNEPEGSRELERIEKLAEEKGFKDNVSPLLNQLKDALLREQQRELADTESAVRKYLRLEIAEKYYGTNGMKKYMLKDDKQAKEAANTLKNRNKYNFILGRK